MRGCSELLLHSDDLEPESVAGEFFETRGGRLTIPGSPQQTTPMPENSVRLRQIAFPDCAFASRSINKQGLYQGRF